MTNYILDFSDYILSEKEAVKYFEKDIIEMKKLNLDISNYLKIEKEYINYFQKLFEINNGIVKVIFKSFGYYMSDYLFKHEKKLFERFFRELKFEQIFFAEPIIITNIEYFKLLIKISYRDIYEGKSLKFIFRKIKLEILPIGDYCYLVKTSKKTILELLKKTRKMKIYLKEI